MAQYLTNLLKGKNSTSFVTETCHRPCVIRIRRVYSDQTKGRTVQGSNPGRGKIFFSSPKRPDRLWCPPSILLNGYRGSFPGVRRSEGDADRWPPSAAEVKNESSPLPIYLHDVGMDNFTLIMENYLPSILRIREVLVSNSWPGHQIFRGYFLYSVSLLRSNAGV
jgi:hypothetical protein